MALTSSQISSKLFKKALGAGETLVNRQFFEEPKLGRDLVLYDQIWSQSNLIPTTAPSLAPGASAGVVQYFQLETLSHVSGSLNLSYFSNNLIDSIPFNYGDGTYNYQLFKNDGITSIAFGEGDWIVDNTAGLLTFYGTLPSGVTSVLPPKISFYKYVGTKGFGAGSGIGTILGVTAGVGLSGGGTAGFITLDVNLQENSGLTFSSDDITLELNTDSLEVDSNNKIRLKNLITGDRTFQDSITIQGDITVNGTVSYINTQNIYIEDNILTLNATFSGSPYLDAGLEVIRGLSTSAAFLWDENLDLWVAGLSGSTSPIVTEVGFGLTKSGNMISIDSISFSNILAGDGLTASSGVLNVQVANGLDIVSDFIILGGTLSQTTIIEADGYDFTISGADNIIFTSSTFDVISDGLVSIDAGVGSVQIVADDNIDLFSMNNSISLNAFSELSISASFSNVTTSDSRGLVYTSDYSGTFVTNSLITKKYVDDAVSIINADFITGVTAGNGLSGGGTSGFITLDVNLQENSGLTFSSDNITVQLNSDSLEVDSVNQIRLKDFITGNRIFQDSITVSTNLNVSGTVSTNTLQVIDGAQDGYILTSDSQGIATWKSTVGSRNIYVDGIYGSNSTGEKYNFNRRFQTILAAESVATDGDTIYVMSSSQSYTDNGIGAIFTNGTTMNYYFERGAKIDIRLLGPTTNIDIFIPDGANLNVMGYGEFIATGCVGLIFGSSSLNLEMLRCKTDNQSTNASATFEVFGSTNTVNVKCHDIIENTQGNILVCMNRDQNVFIESNRIVCSGAVVRTYFSGGTDQSFIKLKTNTAVCNGQNLFGGGFVFDGIFVNDGAKVILEGTFYKRSSNTTSIGFYNTAGETHLYGDYTIANNIANIYGGEVYHYGSILGTQSYKIFGGDVYLKNRLESTASYSVFKSGGNLILDGASILSTTWSIYATGSQDVICYSGACNTDITDNITIRVNPLNINNYVI